MVDVDNKHPHKLLPGQPARTFAVDISLAHDRTKGEYLHTIAAALRKHVPLRFPEYVGTPSILIVPEMRNEKRYPVRSLEELDELIYSTEHDNTFTLNIINDAVKSTKTEYMLLRPVLRELSRRFDFIIYGKRNRFFNTPASNVTLQVKSHWEYEGFAREYHGDGITESNGFVVIDVPKYQYAVDEDVRSIYDLNHYTIKPMRTPLQVPFCSFMSLSPGESDTVHERALVQIVDTLMTGAAPKNNAFVLSAAQEYAFSGFADEMDRFNHVKSFTAMSRWIAASVMGVGTLAVAAASTVAPGLLAFLPGVEWLITSCATVGFSGTVLALSHKSHRDSQRIEALLPQTPFRLSIEQDVLPVPAVPSDMEPEKLLLEPSIATRTPAMVSTVKVTPVPSTSMQTDDDQFRWDQVINRYKRVVDSWIEYEVDILKVLEYPLMSDITCVHTANFHRAMNNAQMYKPSDTPSMPVEESRFFKAVQELEIAFATAEQNAKKSRWSSLDSKQKQSLKTGKSLVSIALDEGASLAERQSAYKQARVKLEGVVFLPERAIEQIEHTVRLEIEA